LKIDLLWVIAPGLAITRLWDFWLTAPKQLKKTPANSLKKEPK
jgi:hypothetical protein